MNKFWDNSLRDPNAGLGKTVAMGLQHTVTMFAATILVPILTGFDIAVALLMAGAGTLLFHLVTKGGVPIFLGSSFAFIAPTLAATAAYGKEYAMGGIVIAGLLYIVLGTLVKFLGAKRILSFFPPIVIGPVIMVIGLGLAPIAIDMANTDWALAGLGLITVVGVAIFCKGFVKSLPVLLGLGVSYGIAALITAFGWATLIDFAPIREAAWFGWPQFTIAKFDIGAIVLIAPVAIVTFVEHVGDVIAVGTICDRDFVKSPGLFRTLLGDGLASSLSAMFGGPANTTYSENTGVLALTKAVNPVIMRIAAVFAILLGCVPKLSAFISTIPSPIIGGISVILFGMIASVGLRTVVEAKVDFQLDRNMIIAAVILVMGIGGAMLSIAIGSMAISLQGMAMAAVVGIILNKVLPGADA
ncbi:MAG: NCS2 family nucleobase:cation symporter [Clostridia bacterium]|nr:NCS2 family nucleobase:cation symporter [Clostridia bacterium]